VQAIDTHGYHARTFSIDPSGRMLVVANLLEIPVRDGDQIKTQPPTLSTYRIGDDGRLTFVHAYDIETKGLTQWWTGFARLQPRSAWAVACTQSIHAADEASALQPPWRRRSPAWFRWTGQSAAPPRPSE